MNLTLPVDEQDVDALVREYLEASAATVDVERLEREITARLGEASAMRPAHASRLPKLLARTGAWATAAVVLVAVSAALYFTLQPEPAGAYALVSAAQQSLEKGPDRCYRVEGRLPEGWLKANPWLRVGEAATVWTRGDRFLVSSDNGPVDVHWGQDESRNFWFIAGDTGFSFRPGETPPILLRTRMYLALNPRQLLNRFLKDFDLTIIKDREHQGQPVVRVWATRKPESKDIVFDTAWIEIDPRTKLVRRLEVERNVGQRTPPFGLIFTFVEQASLPVSDYQAQAHLPPGGVLLGPDQAAERDDRFWELVGRRRPAAAKSQEAADKAPVHSQ